MAQRRRHKSVSDLIVEIDQRLAEFRGDIEGLTLREKVVLLLEVYEGFRDLGVSVVHEHGARGPSGRDRILAYLLDNVGVPVESREIALVSGISEHARRVRELRTQLGYQIASGMSPDPNTGVELKPDQYMLVSADPDTRAACRWEVANGIRKMGGGSKERLLEYLKAHVGQVVTTEELAYVADASEFGRRIRELRTEDGYAVATHFTGRPDLAMGQYVLESLDRVAQPHDRKIPTGVQRRVYERDRNRCRACAWSLDSGAPGDPRFLELHHVIEHADGGANTAENLVVLCNICHDDVHAGRLQSPS